MTVPTWLRPRHSDPAAAMSMIDHIYELRRRLAIALAAVAVATAIGYLWFATGILDGPSLGELLKAPYCDLPASSRAVFTRDGSCTLLGLGPFDQFTLRLKVATTAGAVLASPVWLGQLWGFITPALHRHERRTAITFITAAVTLFATGTVLAYVVVGTGLGFLLSVGNDVQVTALSGDAYFSFVIALMVIFGVSFEVPLLVVMLNRVGVLPYTKLRAWRRGMIFGLFVFAAVVTPGQDPISMTALAAGLTVLVEIAIQIARRHDTVRARREALDPGTAGPIDSPTAIDESTAQPT